MLKDELLFAPEKIGTDGADTFPSTIKTAVDDGHLHPDPVHYVTKHLQQGIESDHFRVKKNMPRSVLPILQYGALKDCRFRSDALAEEGLRFRRRLDRQ